MMGRWCFFKASLKLAVKLTLLSSNLIEVSGSAKVLNLGQSIEVNVRSSKLNENLEILWLIFIFLQIWVEQLSEINWEVKFVY